MRNYVDGVSLTHGTSPNRSHIWTYSSVVFFASGNADRCSICDDNKPSYVGTNYTCVAAQCSNDQGCYPDSLWSNDVKVCEGNGTFYRQLSESTTDDIEMRVCRDQARDDEDILISYMELFVSL